MARYFDTARAAGGQLDEATRLARDALTIADRDGYPLMRAMARVDLAPLLAWTSGPDIALARLMEARDHFERKGARPVVERIDALVERLTPQGVGEVPAAGA